MDFNEYFSLAIIGSPQQGDDLNHFALIKSFIMQMKVTRICDLAVTSHEYGEMYFNYIPGVLISL
jgi:hypothetical protein